MILKRFQSRLCEFCIRFQVSALWNRLPSLLFQVDATILMLKQVPHFCLNTFSELLVWDRWFTSVPGEAAIFWTRVQKIHSMKIMKLIHCPPCRFDAAILFLWNQVPKPIVWDKSSRCLLNNVSPMLSLFKLVDCRLSQIDGPLLCYLTRPPILLQAAAILEETDSQTHSQVLCRQSAKIHACGQLVTRYILLVFCHGSFLDPPEEFHFEKSLCEVGYPRCVCCWCHHPFVETGSQIHLWDILPACLLNSGSSMVLSLNAFAGHFAWDNWFHTSPKSCATCRQTHSDSQVYADRFQEHALWNRLPIFMLKQVPKPIMPDRSPTCLLSGGASMLSLSKLVSAACLRSMTHFCVGWAAAKSYQAAAFLSCCQTRSQVYADRFQKSALWNRYIAPFVFVVDATICCWDRFPHPFCEIACQLVC